MLDIDDDRLVGIEYQVAKWCFIYVIQIYLPSSNHCVQDFTEYMQGFFFAILGRGPRAFQIGEISAVNHYFGKFSKQTRTAFLVSLKTKLAITHTIAIKLKENRMQF